MPNNTQTIKVEVSAQPDTASLDKITRAIEAAGGKATGGGISKTFPEQEQAISFLKEQAAAQKQMGGRLVGQGVQQTAGGYQASAGVEGEAQKKAFSPGGAIAAMATGVGVAVGFFKQLLGMSKIFQTFMGTTGKILATAVDLMLAPLMPFFMRIMVWLIQTIFPLATKAGNFFGNIADMGMGGLAATAVGGYVALKIGKSMLKDAGEKIGKWFVDKMDGKTIGAVINKGIKDGASTLVEWGTKVGGYIKDGLIATKDVLVTFSKNLGTAIKDGFIAAKDLMVEMSKTLGTAIKDGFVAAKDAMVTVATSLGTAIKTGFVAAKDAMVTMAESLGTAIKTGFVAAKDAMVTMAESLGTAIKTGFVAAKDAMVTMAESLGTAIKTGFIAAKDAMVTMAESLGTAIKTGFIAAKDALVTFSKTLGTAIKDGFVAAKDALVTFSKTLGTAIKDGFVAAKDALVTFSKTLGTAIKDGFIAAKDLMVTMAKSLGTAMKDGFILAKDLMVTMAKSLGTAISDGLIAAKSAMEGVFKTMGGALSSAATGAMKGATAVWSAIGGLIGAAIGASKKAFTMAGDAIGTAIGGAMKGAKSLWSGLGSVGGLIGVGIGAAAIGATIGFMIWKEYDKYQKGKDITKDLSKLEQVRMLQSEYGVSEQQAKVIQEGMEAGGVSTSREGMGDFMDMSKDLADQIRLFGTYNSETLANMERGEQLLFAQMMEMGFMGDSKHFAPMAGMIRGGTRDGVSIGSAEETLAKAELLTQEERRKAAEAEIEAQAWYAMSIGGQHINFLDMGAKALMGVATGGLSRLPGANWLTGKATSALGFGTAEGNVQKDEQRVREALGQLYGGGKFKGDMSAEQVNLGAWLSAYQGDAASSFLPKQVAEDILGGKYQDTEITRMSGSVLNIILNTESLDFLTAEQREKLSALLPAALESGVVSSQ